MSKGQAMRQTLSTPGGEQPSLMRVSHSVLLVEAWEVVGDQAKMRGGNVQAAASNNNSSGGEARPGERSLQAGGGDLPPTNPRQCIYPS